ncbi:MAG: hypothetical protein KA793_08240 [Bacteroidales bacterium]|nr:hypothetical protein [Bacteroidales bacterium]
MRRPLPSHLILILIIFFGFCFESLHAQAPEITIGTGRTKRVLFIGDSISIWWSVQGAKRFSCAELGMNDLPMEGKIYVSPKQSTSYVFVAERGNSNSSKRISIDVVSPVLLTFNAPDRITDEGTYSISWQAENADFVTIAGVKEKLPIEGRIEFKSTRDTIIRIAACNKAGYADRQTKKVKVNYVESIACTEKVGIGKLVKVEWKYKNAYKIAIDNVSDSLPPIGSMNIPMIDSYSYGVRIYRNNGTVDESFFNVQVVQPKIVFFNGNTVVKPGEEVTLTWACENVDSVTLSLNKGKTTAKGKFSFKPETSTEVVLKAWLNGFFESRTLQIDINDMPDFIENDQK